MFAFVVVDTPHLYMPVPRAAVFPVRRGPVLQSQPGHHRVKVCVAPGVFCEDVDAAVGVDDGCDAAVLDDVQQVPRVE